MASEHDSGTYVSQPSGYKAFVPTPLPSTFVLTPELQQKLSRADRALGRLDGSILTLPDSDLFVLMYVRKEAVLSSQIEGTQSSLTDVLNAEAEVNDPNSPKDVSEVLNYVTAMNHGLTRLEEIPVSIRLIREIHGILLRDVRGQHLEPGELRRSQNWIGPPVSSLNSASFVPPPPHEMELALSQWEKFLHARDDIPLLARIGLAHCQFETIHPFLDGNGRVGRLLITFLLCEKEVLAQPVLYLSHYFKRHRQEYYDSLQAVRDSDRWTHWLSFFLDGVAVVSNEAASTARNIVSLREADRLTIQNSFGRTAANGLRVLEHLYSRPIISVKTIKELTSLSSQSAGSLMQRFVDEGLLTEITGQQRNRKFSYTRYVALFAD
ncbi:MAG: Fic family protein [Pseudomonadaceae bacterium]|nr:Fic family protein [Pseudomonadaceae bacterium]